MSVHLKCPQLSGDLFERGKENFLAECHLGPSFGQSRMEGIACNKANPRRQTKEMVYKDQPFFLERNCVGEKWKNAQATRAYEKGLHQPSSTLTTGKDSNPREQDQENYYKKI